MQKFSLDSIGTHLTLSIDTPHLCGELFSSIEKRLVHFENKFSRFKAENWLDELNHRREGTLDDDAKFMLTYALDVSKRTGGYFDPTVGKRLSELGYGAIMNHSQSVIHKGKHNDYREIEIIGDIVQLHGDILLEFGGVGKGYLIDVIKEMIDEYYYSKSIPLPRYLIDFGGDLYGYGGWKVGLENPHVLEEIIGVLLLDDIFLACSSGSKRKWGNNHHLIDPKTGESATDVIASFIEGPSGISTDAYATSFCVMPYEESCELLREIPFLEGVILASDGRYFRSSGSKSEIFTA
ncbi:MAG: FAD:protein FMN transferase [Candidatus Altimarinota bacterium]